MKARLINGLIAIITIFSFSSGVTVGAQSVSTDDARGLGPTKSTASKSNTPAIRSFSTPTTPSSFPADCPTTINCVVIPAPYVANGGDVTDYGNYDLTNRPHDMKINSIVIHDTEGTLQSALDHFQDTHAYVSINYIVDAANNRIIEEVPNQDVAWHAGNWWYNMHAIGIEHIGFSADSSSYTDTMYKLSATLVRYLTTKYNIPRDRGHIIGHDNVPGTTTAAISGMHTDPGPFWNWQKYMDLINRGESRQPESNNLNSSSLNSLNMTRTFNLGVTVSPAWSSNKQSVTGCTSPTSCVPDGLQSTNFVYLHTQPSLDSPLFSDPVKGQGTTDINNTSARLYYGQTFAIVDYSFDQGGLWIKVAVNGAYGWFYSPWSAPNAFPAFGGQYVTPKNDGESVYGQPVPEKSEYPADLVSVPPASFWIKFPTPLPYTLKSGQKYKVLSTNVPTDYFYAWASDSSFPYDHTVFTGATKYLEIQLGNRVGFVKASDVNL